MSSFAVLGLGLLVGMQHALEADHIAAVSSLAARQAKVTGVVKHGLLWGLGHTLTLFTVSGVAILLGTAVPQSVAAPLEAAAGLMLVGIGAHLLSRLWWTGVHLQGRSHGDGTEHTHVHSHKREAVPYAQVEHTHEHRIPWRSLCVGLMHGMAGSAALLVLAVSQVSNPLEGLLYVLLFGMGSMLGMTVLCGVIGVPLVLSARFLTWANRSLQGIIGAVTVGIGLSAIHAFLTNSGS
jgi:hypothetical protein